ncbi:formate/nitrite transporter family protein [Solitalea sp. MAHUQ-68]|uniref:Formate/nitrite transporter family protein n=1 Tax=Solitalea agri TaxID=2953739 RepID=A0A9X2F0T7_9SPHI|nr:formate/nitrite transporter family protein [Solitalea agri]MCO4292604.1 formate/nitrite transporter family protein [Solitalea agri]
MAAGYHAPQEITEYALQVGIKKANTDSVKILILGFMGGIFLGLAGHGTMVVAQQFPDSLGFARLLSGIIFPVGLITILLAGADLFTGNCLIMISVLDGKTKWSAFLKNLSLAYIGNLLGSLLVVFSLYYLNQVNHADGSYGAYAIKAAAYKSNLTFSSATLSGIFANLLVCAGVWLCYGAKDLTGKIFGTFFPIYLFIILGLEHVIANMYYIPMGLLCKNDPAFVAEAMSKWHVTPEKLSHLTLSNAIFNNFIPVTIGNFIGGAILLGGVSWFMYLRKEKNPAGVIYLRNEHKTMAPNEKIS